MRKILLLLSSRNPSESGTKGKFAFVASDNSPMPVIHIKKGLDLPIPGGLTAQNITDVPDVSRVALLPQECPGIKVKMLVRVGDKVKVGSPLFCDRRDEAAVFGSPAAGEVVEINRGYRRAVQSVVVAVDNFTDQIQTSVLDLNIADGTAIRAAIIASGLWPVLRRRPLKTVAHTSETPRSIFVTASDTHPLAPKPLDVLAGHQDTFRAGLQALTKLTEGAVHLCTDAGADFSAMTPAGAETTEFYGPHPAGNAGVHINALDPVGAERFVWHIGYQDVAAIGALLTTGKYENTRVIAMVGPECDNPHLMRTHRGACMQEMLGSHLKSDKQTRVISGSVLGGMTTNPSSVTGYLGRYCNQVTLLSDDTQSEFVNWVMPIGKRHTTSNTLLNKFIGKMKWDTDLNGGHRAIVPTGTYEEVMPMSIMATQMVKALASQDLEYSEQLGVLELAEEDVALMEYVCQSKTDVTGKLRDMLTIIEKEG